MAENGTRKRPGKSTEMAPPDSGSSSVSSIPCGACKFLRRRCVNGCVFAPHFGPEHGPAMFAAMHKVFGASNVAKLLIQLPYDRRHDAIVSMSYEAQARMVNPVYGCVSTVISLQQEVATLRTELAKVQNELINNNHVVANALQGSGQQLGPVYSNCPSAYNLANDDLYAVNDNLYADYSQPCFDPFQFSQLSGKNTEDIEEETGDPFAFADQMFLSK